MDDQSVRGEEQAAHIQLISRKVKTNVPDNQKDDRYWEKRKRNNIAAKRSRENKRFTEINIRRKMRLLEEENAILRKEISVIKSKYGVPEDQILLSEGEKALCRAQVYSESKHLDNSSSRVEEVSSPVSTTSASVSTSPQRATPDTQYPAEEFDPIEDTAERTMPEDSYNNNRRKVAVAGRRQTRRQPVPQALFYGSSYGAQLMWASARTLNSGSLSGNMQQFYQEYSMNNEDVPFVTEEHPVPHQGQYPRYPSAPRPNCPRSLDYPQVYKNHFDYPPTNYDIFRAPTDLSTPREKYSDEGCPTRLDKKIDNDHTVQSAENKFRGDQSQGGNVIIRKRRLSEDYMYNDYLMGGDQAMRSSQSSSQPVLAPESPHFTPSQWQDARRTPDAQYPVSHHRSDECYYDRRPHQDLEPGRLADNYPNQDASPAENGQLRRENEDLKDRLRQLFSQVSKMKDMVLPD